MSYNPTIGTYLWVLKTYRNVSYWSKTTATVDQIISNETVRRNAILKGGDAVYISEIRDVNGTLLKDAATIKTEAKPSSDLF